MAEGLDETTALALELVRRTSICLLDDLSIAFEHVGEKVGAARLESLRDRLQEKDPDAMDTLHRCMRNARYVDE